MVGEDIYFKNVKGYTEKQWVRDAREIPFFFFKQKTAYEITYGDWSSDVCSSDLASRRAKTDPSPSDRDRTRGPHARSEERRVGKECRRLCRSRWSRDH